MGFRSLPGTCNAFKHSAPAHGAIINDGSSRWIQKLGSIISILCKEALKGTCHISGVIHNHLKTRYLKRWISRHSKSWHDLMDGPLNQKELPTSQSLKPASSAWLSHGRSDIGSSQQPSIICSVTYLTLGDVIKCGTDSSPLYQNNSRNITKGPSICPGIYSHGKANILWFHGRDVLIRPPSQNLPITLKAFKALAWWLP